MEKQKLTQQELNDHLLSAAREGSHGYVSLALAAGADPLTFDGAGFRAIDIAKNRMDSPNVANNQDYRDVVRLLEEADTKKQSHAARVTDSLQLRPQNVAIVDHILKPSAEKQKAAIRSLFDAAEVGNIAAAQKALDAGATINVRNIANETPLHVAASYGQKDFADWLIENGADLNAKTDYRDSPLVLAKALGHNDVASLLENAAKQQGHAGRVTGERKDKGPPQVGG